MPDRPRRVCIPCGTTSGPDGIVRVEVSAVVALLHAAADALPTLGSLDHAALALRDQAAAMAALAEAMAVTFAATEGAP